MNKIDIDGKLYPVEDNLWYKYQITAIKGPVEIFLEIKQQIIETIKPIN